MPGGRPTVADRGAASIGGEGRRWGWGAALKQTGYLSAQFPRVHGLGEVAVRADAEQFHLVALAVGYPGAHYQRHVAVDGARAQQAADLLAPQRRQVEVRDDQVGPHAQACLQPPQPVVVHLHRGWKRALRCHPENQGVLRTVLDDGYVERRVHHPCPLRPGTAAAFSRPAFFRSYMPYVNQATSKKRRGGNPRLEFNLWFGFGVAAVRARRVGESAANLRAGLSRYLFFRFISQMPIRPTSVSSGFSRFTWRECSRRVTARPPVATTPVR